MKKAVLFTLTLAAVAGVANAQTKTKTGTHPTTTKTQVGAGVPLKTSLDSVSYAIGLNIATFYKQQGIQKLNNSVVLRAIDDVLKAQKCQLTDDEMRTVLTSYMSKATAEKSAVNKRAGAAFLEENKKKPGVVTLPSGLQYTIIKQGDGAKPALTDKVKVHYHGTLLNGTVFDSSVDRGEPVDLNVNAVIPGWTEALQLMPVGSKWKLFIPSDLAYGDRDAGPAIKAGSTLVFDVELLDIVK